MVAARGEAVHDSTRPSLAAAVRHWKQCSSTVSTTFSISGPKFCSTGARTRACQSGKWISHLPGAKTRTHRDTATVFAALAVEVAALALCGAAVHYGGDHVPLEVLFVRWRLVRLTIR